MSPNSGRKSQSQRQSSGKKSEVVENSQSPSEIPSVYRRTTRTEELSPASQPQFKNSFLPPEMRGDQSPKDRTTANNFFANMQEPEQDPTKFFQDMTEQERISQRR